MLCCARACCASWILLFDIMVLCMNMLLCVSSKPVVSSYIRRVFPPRIIIYLYIYREGVVLTKHISPTFFVYVCVSYVSYAFASDYDFACGRFCIAIDAKHPLHFVFRFKRKQHTHTQTHLPICDLWSYFSLRACTLCNAFRDHSKA